MTEAAGPGRQSDPTRKEWTVRDKKRSHSRKRSSKPARKESADRKRKPLHRYRRRQTPRHQNAADREGGERILKEGGMGACKNRGGATPMVNAGKGGRCFLREKRVGAAVIETRICASRGRVGKWGRGRRTLTGIHTGLLLENKQNCECEGIKKKLERVLIPGELEGKKLRATQRANMRIGSKDRAPGGGPKTKTAQETLRKRRRPRENTR